MATINWRGKSAQLNWSEGGRQRRLSLGRISPADAEIRRKAKELEIATGRKLFIASARFEDHLAEYLKWHRIEYPSSHFRVKWIGENAFDAFKGKALSQITPKDVEAWKQQRMTRYARIRGKLAQVSAETAAKEFRTLKAVLNKAVAWKEISECPATEVEQPKNVRDQPIHWYTKAELAKLYKRRLGQVWRLKSNAGLRRREILQLRPEHIDFKANEIRVLSSRQARTKSGKWRAVPLSKSGRAAALRLIRENGKTGFVIPHVTGESLSRAFAKDLKTLGLSGSLHSLRHSYGAHMVMAGVSLRVLQVLMGHADMKTTERYAHVGRDHAREQAKLVNL